MLYDTHCHPYLAKEKTQENVLENFFSWWWSYLNTIAVDIESSRTSIHLSEQYEWVFATIWIHPTHSIEYIWKLDETMSALESLYELHKDNIVAIWECWLDYYWLESLVKKYELPEKDIIYTQMAFFRAHIKLAQKYNLPLIIHNRNASEDIFAILQTTWFTNFIFHCFSEDYNFAKKLIDFAPECKLWFGWVATFKNAHAVQEALSHIPLKNIIIETDSPYLTPIPHRGKQENEPIYTQYVLDKIIELRNESPRKVQKAIFENSKNCFWIS